MTDYKQDRASNPQLIEKHPTFWFSDGSLVIAAKSKKRSDHITLFKVHKSVLAHHSPIFRDMFEISDISEKRGREENDLFRSVQQVYEGLPVLEVQDTAEDWAGLLRPMYGEVVASSSQKYNPDLELMLLGPMHLAKKYDMDKLIRLLIPLVEAQWPRTLMEWDIYTAHTKKHPKAHLEPVAAIVLATEHGITSILPAAFYMLSQIGIYDDYDSNGPKTKELTARWDLLSQRDYRRLIFGKEALPKRIEGFVATLFRCLSWACTGKAALLNSLRDQRDFLSILTSLKLTDIRCSKCAETAQDPLRNLRELTWDSLPVVFNFEDNISAFPEINDNLTDCDSPPITRPPSPGYS